MSPNVTIKIETIEELIKTYLDTHNHGVFFLPTDELMELEESLVLNLHIDIPEFDIVRFDELDARVCWVNKKATKARPRGLGLRVDDERSNDVINKISPLVQSDPIMASHTTTYMI